MMALLVLSRLTPFETIFVRLNCDSSHISMHFFKSIKIGEFLCSYFNIEDGRKYIFSVYYALLFQERYKNTTEIKKKDLLQCMEKVL